MLSESGGRKRLPQRHTSLIRQSRPNHMKKLFIAYRFFLHSFFPHHLRAFFSSSVFLFLFLLSRANPVFYRTRFIRLRKSLSHILVITPQLLHPNYRSLWLWQFFKSAFVYDSGCFLHIRKITFVRCCHIFFVLFSFLYCFLFCFIYFIMALTSN